MLRTASALALLSITVSSCATLRNVLSFTKPDVALQEIDLTGIGMTGGTMDLIFDVYNPNDYRLRSTRLEVALALAGTDFGEALIDKPLDLSPQNHSRVVMPVRLRGRGWARRPAHCCNRKNCPIRLPGL